MSDCKHHQQCVNNALREGEKICQENGLRFTTLRRKVLELIWQSHKPAKAYDILDQLSDDNGQAKPPTVYRTLDFLLENGLIHRLNSLNAYVGCSHPVQHHDCYFLICKKCEEVVECCNTGLTQAIEAAASKNQFTTDQAILEIQGLCKSCSQE